MLPPPFRIFNYELWIELIYSLVVVISCLLIYLKTGEFYELTSHKGIKYFRNTFLFFGIGYLIRLCLHLIQATGISRILFTPFAIGIYEMAFFVMIYASSMALIYIIYSMFWKRLDKYAFSRGYVFHIVSLIVAFVSMVWRIPLIFLLFQGALFLLLVVVSYLNYRKTKHKGGLYGIYLIYMLIFALWITINVLEFVIYFSPIMGLIIYGASIALFAMLLVKVIKELKPKK